MRKMLVKLIVMCLVLGYVTSDKGKVKIQSITTNTVNKVITEITGRSFSGFQNMFDDLFKFPSVIQ